MKKGNGFFSEFRAYHNGREVVVSWREGKVVGNDILVAARLAGHANRSTELVKLDGLTAVPSGFLAAVRQFHKRTF